MEEDDKDIFLKSVHDIYVVRPNSIYDTCLVSFAVNFYCKSNREADKCNSKNNMDEWEEPTDGET